VEPFRSTIIACDASWHYLDVEGKQQGPLDIVALEKLFAEGDVDGLTMVWHAGMEEWKAIAECHELRRMLVRQDHEEEEEEEEKYGDGGPQKANGRPLPSEVPYDESMVGLVS